jgi:non-ribosomal peptide synthetase component F
MAGTGESVSYAEYEARTNRLAHLLRAQGLGRLDHYAIFSCPAYRPKLYKKPSATATGASPAAASCKTRREHHRRELTPTSVGRTQADTHPPRSL